MDILKLFIAKYILGFILQNIIFVLGIFTFNKRKVDQKTFLLIIAFFSPVTILVRLLPISFGIHTLLNLVVILLITFRLFDFELYQTIRSTLMSIVLLLTTEIIGLSIMLLVFGQERINTAMMDNYSKSIIAIPINFLYGSIILILYKLMEKKA